ncbi:hypothetical protein ES695_03230 [Candidatus Atribacteria bacterium 1244-E10-H5-B2]|nr:MAG: hypothetical protein ES695_03230 [Candidatus Atribacteria bacterium 1244-E10-H5-B2]
MRIKVTEYSGEIGKIPEYLNYEFIIDLNAPGFKERFFEKREKALKKYSEMKRRIISNVLQEVS